MTFPTRPRCRWCGGRAVKGSICPWSVPCPSCGAGAGLSCQRPSGHKASRLHAARYHFTEAQDAANGVTYPQPRSS